MAEEKFVQTERMRKAQEKLDNMSPEEQEEKLRATRERLRRYYESGLARPHIRALQGKEAW